MNQEKIIWHVGKMKTASTYLQRKIFPKLESVIFLGWYTKIKNPSFYNEEIRKFDEYLRYSDDFDVDNDIVTNFLQKIELIHKKYNLKILISDEGICTDENNIYRNLQRIKKIDTDATVVISIRKQSDYLLSQYYQYRRGVFGNKAWKNMSINAFLDKDIRGHVKDANYFPLIQEAVELFGIDNIIVVPYEYLKQSPNLYVESFNGIISDSDTQIFNDLISNSSKEHARTKNKFFDIVSNILGEGFISNFICKLPLMFHRFIYCHYTASDVDKWMENNEVSYADGNLKIQNLLSIDLEPIGYEVK